MSFFTQEKNLGRVSYSTCMMSCGCTVLLTIKAAQELLCFEYTYFGELTVKQLDIDGHLVVPQPKSTSLSNVRGSWQHFVFYGYI